MKNFTLISSTLLLLFITDSNAQLTGTTVAPLQLGNIWVYDVGSAKRKITVVDTNIVIDTLSYFKLSIGSLREYARLNEDGFYVLRMDSTYTEPNHELPYYKKDAVIGDTWTVQTYFTYSIEDTFTANVFGELTTVKYLKMDGGIILRHEYWAEKFGLLSSSDFGGLLESLLGCVIDGVVYGDTSFNLVGVEDELRPANNFILKQNYPNPFNPKTKIKYSIPELSYVTITVYDILGNKVETLVNEEKLAGDFEVDFNAVNLPSGIYFYQLIIGNPTASSGQNFVDTKKLILLK